MWHNAVLNGGCAIILIIICDHVNNNKSQKSSGRHKSPCTVYTPNAEMRLKRHIFFWNVISSL